MDLRLIDAAGQAVSTVPVCDELFGRAVNQPLVHQVVTAYLANARLATRAQKARGEVAKSTRKPWRQKGTGRARAGMASSPLWRGGGRIFPNSPEENFHKKLNRKMYRAGICSILSQLAREGRLAVVEDLRVEAPKTKLLAARIKSMGLERVMVITEALDDNLQLSARNLPNLLLVEVGHTDPVSLLRYPNVLLTLGAVRKLEEMLR
jgi:large subunit ribosomal protein L4